MLLRATCAVKQDAQNVTLGVLVNCLHPGRLRDFGSVSIAVLRDKVTLQWRVPLLPLEPTPQRDRMINGMGSRTELDG